MELIGRERELTEVVDRIADGSRLVAVIGPGGIGKTALARGVMERIGGSFPLGAHFVDLSRIERSDAVAGTMAAQLGFPSFDALLQSPTDQPALVVVDNCEHVADAAADAIATLLEHCAAPRVLATSRSPLDLPGESIVALGPLAVPGVGTVDETSSVRLFRDRARDAGGGRDDHEGELVGELCRRLDGVPLAIEIAAARTRALAVGDIVKMLDSGIDVLSRPRFRGSPRHRSVRDTITWSYRLLDDDARAAFDCLGVCVGPFTPDLAAAVVAGPDARSGDVLDVLHVLVDASLLVVDRSTPRTRYRMLDTVRAAALAQLEDRGEVGTVRDRFVSHMAGAVGRLLDESRRCWPAGLLVTLLEEYDNIAAAIGISVDRDADPERSHCLYSALWGAVHQAHVDDIAELGKVVMSRWPDLVPPYGADAAATFAIARLLCGDVDDAVETASRALPRADGCVFAPVTLRRCLGLAARASGDHEGAAALLAEAAGLAAARGIPTMAMECAVYGAQDLAAAGDRDQALRIVRDAAHAATTAGSALNEIWARSVEGALLASVDSEAAQPLVESTLAAAEAGDYPFGIMINLRTLAMCHLRRGSPAEAASVVLRLLDVVGRSGSGDLRLALDLAAAVLRAAGRPGWEDLAATSRTLPNTNPMAMTGDELELPLDGAGRVLSRQDASRQARVQLAELRSVEHATAPARAAAAEPRDRGTAEAVFVRVGERWDVRFAGIDVSLNPAKGMDDLAVLLGHPGREFHCLDLAGAAVQEAPAGEALDATARRRYEARVRELQAELDEAEAHHDHGRADRARVELDTLVDHLTAALGLSGKARRPGGTAERARSAVTHRLRDTVRRIAAVHPPLGRHLDASVTTGLYCSYRPERSTHWRT